MLWQLSLVLLGKPFREPTPDSWIIKVEYGSLMYY